ncbi:MAG: oxygenase MpaB family protein [Solirubrobacteraceae bacterium]|nr:oxygenase MpaB family protein [Solirubrobacteraceae bacterium]
MTGAARPTGERRVRKRSDALDRPFFPEGSLIREVQRERTVALSGARALFMQAAHPVAFVGFFSHTASADDPHPRLARTALAVNTVIYGTERQAREVEQIVGSMHARVSGVTTESVGIFPAGTPFRGDDPDLLLWILAAFIDSSYRAFERYVRPLSDEEREELWQEWRRVGEIFGLGRTDMPSSYEIFTHYVEGMLASGQLVVTPAARELSRRVILNPPLPPYMVAAKELVNQITIDSLPPGLRDQFGFVPVPGRGVALGAFSTWMRWIGNPLAPRVVREVPEMVMPAPDRNYADIVEIVQREMSG